MPYPLIRPTLLRLLARRVHVEGWEHVPPRGPYIIAANHQSYLDPPQIAFPIIVKRNTKVWFLTTEHVWKAFSKLGGRGFIRWMGMIPILNSRKGESLAPAIERLEAGGVVGIFPEGMRNIAVRNPDSEKVLLHGKTGTVRMALATGVPIIPAGIVAPPGTTTWQALRNFFNQNQKAIVRYGPPIQWPKVDPAAVSKDELNAKTTELMTAIGQLCGKEYRV